MIRDDGYDKYSIWEHSEIVRNLYARRCRLEEEEMTSAAQAADLLAPLVQEGEVLLDVGCGSGYFFHSLRNRNIPAEYWGVDASPTLIEIGRTIMPQYGLPAERLRVVRLEDLDGQVDHVVCLNVLTNLDNFHRPLERLLAMTRRSLILRESIKAGAQYLYVKDEYLDDGVDLYVHVNSYDPDDLRSFAERRGFSVELITDERTKGEPEDVIGYPHHWTFLMATKNKE